MKKCLYCDSHRCDFDDGNIINLVPVSTAAKRLGLKPGAVKRHCRKGDLRAVKIAGEWLIHEDGIETFRQKATPR